MYNLRYALLHGGDSLQIKPKRQTLHPRLEVPLQAGVPVSAAWAERKALLPHVPCPQVQGRQMKTRVSKEENSVLTHGFCPAAGWPEEMLAGDAVQFWDVREMSGAIEGMDGWINSNTHSGDFLRSGCEIFFSWGNLEQLELPSLLLMHYCFYL